MVKFTKFQIPTYKSDTCKLFDGTYTGFPRADLFQGKCEYRLVVIKSNLLLSHHHSTSALVSEILMSVLQKTKNKQNKKTTIYIWTVHIYRLYRRQCAKYTYIYSVHIVYYKDILNYQVHIIHRMCTYTLCTLYTIYTLCSLYIVIM